jgi:hypothetical protein
MTTIKKSFDAPEKILLNNPRLRGTKAQALMREGHSQPAEIARDRSTAGRTLGGRVISKRIETSDR